MKWKILIVFHDDRQGWMSAGGRDVEFLSEEHADAVASTLSRTVSVKWALVVLTWSGTLKPPEIPPMAKELQL